ncbi:precorrin-3B synthase [Sulfitobacter mediterraneus]|uniref:Precorrin-3B synthase n=1 Tax=Sulfitobacter mediterraneus TaxID=83219 RepID=A0A061SUY9_9RHOB|nr:precorrin-3B synthase [Sulfitobacter mediterraneus]KAJ03573.1 precorrin-3B synthase [Sulfitobacter mediterraneus]
MTNAARPDDDPLIKGWCPGALRPMLSGDGLVVRVRPFGGRLRRAQVDGLASLAAAHGNGMVDLSSRGNLQLRGVREDSFGALIEGLRGLSLLDANAEVEGRRNILITPFWTAGDETEYLSAALGDALAKDNAPDLPVKFGFAVDTGDRPVLQSASADIRLERDAQGGLILRPDGAAQGKQVDVETAVAEAMQLAHWFAAHRGEHKRMAKLLASGQLLPDGFTQPMQKQTYQPAPGLSEQGVLTGLAFGQLTAQTLAGLAKHGALRMTPWRMVLIEGAEQMPELPDLVATQDDPLLQVAACTGAPGCPQALIETRPLARALARQLQPDQTLHVSGCAKGCAHPKPAALTITGTAQGLSLIHNGRASDEPAQTGHSPHSILKAI